MLRPKHRSARLLGPDYESALQDLESNRPAVSGSVGGLQQTTQGMHTSPGRRKSWPTVSWDKLAWGHTLSGNHVVFQGGYLAFYGSPDVLISGGFGGPQGLYYAPKTNITAGGLVTSPHYVVVKQAKDGGSDPFITIQETEADVSEQAYYELPLAAVYLYGSNAHVVTPRHNVGNCFVITTFGHVSGH